MDSNDKLLCNKGCNCFVSQNEEFITLADPKLSLFTGEEGDVDMMIRPSIRSPISREHTSSVSTGVCAAGAVMRTVRVGYSE